MSYYGVDKLIAEEFIASLNEHIAYVREAGKTIGVPEIQLAVHDHSKWTQAEFPGYAKHFKGGGAPQEYAAAWLHHIHHNPHHWQHWIFPDGFTVKGSNVENGVVEMPQHFVLEMIADWMGASRAYTGSWDMKDWLGHNLSKVRLHRKSAIFLRQTLTELGYADVIQ